VPDLGGFDPPAVVGLSDVGVGVSVRVEQFLARPRDGHDVRDGAVTKARHRPFINQALPFERPQVLAKSCRVADLALEILGERDPVLPGTFQKIHF
jgi:hypothetical protein